MTLSRGGYFVAYGCFLIFFIMHLSFGRVASIGGDRRSTNIVMFTMACLTIFITKTDKRYLIQSKPLRMMIAACGIIGMLVFANFLRIDL